MYCSNLIKRHISTLASIRAMSIGVLKPVK